MEGQLLCRLQTYARLPSRLSEFFTLFELSSRDIELRGEVIATTLSERGEPVIRERHRAGIR